ncbi:MAG: hypothetical protein ABFD89_14140 [Bryobacteraceae bacterium]
MQGRVAMGRTITNDQLKHWHETCRYLADLLQNIDERAGRLQAERKQLLLPAANGEKAARSTLTEIGQKLAKLATERQIVDDALTKTLHSHDGAQAAHELEDRQKRTTKVRESAKQIAAFGLRVDEAPKHLAELLIQRRQAVQDLVLLFVNIVTYYVLPFGDVFYSADYRRRCYICAPRNPISRSVVGVREAESVFSDAYVYVTVS